VSAGARFGTSPAALRVRESAGRGNSGAETAGAQACNHRPLHNGAQRAKLSGASRARRASVGSGEVGEQPSLKLPACANVTRVSLLGSLMAACAVSPFSWRAARSVRCQ
jgi:hypothetical protein